MHIEEKMKRNNDSRCIQKWCMSKVAVDDGSLSTFCFPYNQLRPIINDDELKNDLFENTNFEKVDFEYMGFSNKRHLNRCNF